ncbi:hypothetical protein ED28_10990 [[Pantoea] beijingensis]|uniref:Uncharacterized protein n=1 Tax=[Pantoea] beijingensis TaxID=1324864 RepID=A0A443ID66_9GAMM|nr:MULTISPECIES: tetratricopeptide repeat protein [Erwiniaceae]RWR02148.1 hypothetical protein ED28_10990 [[Pantoea] beijingensis]
MKIRYLINALRLMALTALLMTGFAHAMGDDSDMSPTCPKGQIYDKKTKTCMVDKSSMIDDNDRTDYAYALAKSGRYAEALQVLDQLEQPDTAKAWNYRGYATRKLGRTDEGIGYYQKSIALDPHYAKVREYLGEAYMIKKQPEMAQQQLSIIKNLCGTECEEYRDLSAAIAGHPEA